jgi:DNA repair protein SbcC/Rad50
VVPETLHLRNFMCYGEDLPPLQLTGIHVACLSGHNGAGKSALLDAITWALWGKARAKSDDDLITLGRDEMEVTLEFCLGQQRYRVVRRRKRGKRQGTTTLDLQVRDADGSWRRLTGDTIAETQALINDALRIEYDTFINSAFLVQGRADEFTGRKPAERKQVLADILGLSEYETLERRARDETNRLSKSLDIVESHITRLQSEADQLPQLEQALADAQERVTLLQDEQHDHESALGDLREQASRLQEASERRESIRQTIERLTQERQDLADQIARTHAEIGRFESMIARREEIEAGIAALRAAESRKDQLDTLRDQVQELREQYRALDDQVREARHAIELEQHGASERLSDLEQQLARRESLERERAALMSHVAALLERRDELARLRSDERRLTEQQTTVLELQARVAELRGTINVRHDSLIAAREEQQRRADALQSALDQLPGLEQQLRSIKGELIRLQQIDDELATRRDELAAAMEQQGALRAEAEAIKAEGRELNERLEIAQRGEADCPVCGSELGAEGLQRLIDDYLRQRESLRARHAELRTQLQANETTQADHRARIEELESLLSRRGAREGERARLELQIAQAHESQAALAEVTQTLATLETQLDQQDFARDEQAELREVESRLRELGEAPAIKRELQRLGATIQAAEREIEQGEQERQQLARLDADLAALDRLAAELPATRERVDAITGRIEREEYAEEARRERDEVKQRGVALGYDSQEHDSLRAQVESLRGWEQELSELERALYYIEREREQLRRDQQQQERVDAELATRQRELGALDEQLRDKPAIDSALRDAIMRGHEIMRALAESQGALGRAQSDLDRCRRDAEELDRQRAHVAQLREEHGVFEELAQAFGKKGVQAMLIETAIPELEHEANTLLGRMTDNQFHLEFVTQREKKSGGDSPIETLDIRISDGMGTRDYQMFSGGEAFRVNFAIRIALSKLLARRAGANLRTLIIDEGFGSQDNVGRDRVVEAINSIEKDFERILVITHIQELKELFESQIEIKKTPDGSVWAIV